jgi:hypothetical protein
MSQSSVKEQVNELAAAGFPVSPGTCVPARDGKVSPEQFGSDLWLSRWAQNVFRNYPLVSQCFGARFLHEACHGTPAFVIGVGPSLDDSIKELKAAKKRSVIISTDAALRALLANGITPDLVVSFDCKDDQKRLWDTVADKIPCLFNSCTHPSSIASWPGPILFYNQYHTQDDLCHRILPVVLPELGQIPSSGTVGNMAIMAAHLMGCNPICAVGMDFCFKQSGDHGNPRWRYRAQDYKYVPSLAPGISDGWALTEIKELYDNDDRMSRSFIVKDEYNHEFRTDPELAFYLNSFKDLMPHFKVPVVNCSPDGMIPLSYEQLTVTGAIDKYCKTPEFQGGRSILGHLAKIVPDPRKS